MTTCPDIGLLRAALDGEAEDTRIELPVHLATCPACRETLASLRLDADLSAAALGTLAPTSTPTAADVALARARINRAHAAAATVAVETLPAREPVPMTLRTRFAHWRAAAAGLAAAAALVFLVGTPLGRTAAAEFLAQFRSEKFQVITLNSQQGQQRPFEDLQQLGTVESPLNGRRGPGTETVATLDEASRRVGFTVKTPAASALPDGLDNTPAIEVMKGQQVRFTLDRQKALDYFKAHGNEVVIPVNLDKASLVINIPSAALLHYKPSGQQGDASGPANIGVVVGEAGLVTAGVEGGSGGATLDEFRDVLLEMPGLDASTIRQIKAIKDPENTLPIPIPVDKVAFQDATIAGSKGLILDDKSGLGSAAIWQANDVVYGVAGPLTSDELQSVANSIH